MKEETQQKSISTLASTRMIQIPNTQRNEEKKWKEILIDTGLRGGGREGFPPPVD